MNGRTGEPALLDGRIKFVPRFRQSKVDGAGGGGAAGDPMNA